MLQMKTSLMSRKRGRNTKPHNILEHTADTQRTADTHTRCSPATCFCWGSRPRAATASCRCHSTKATCTLLTRCGQLWGLKPHSFKIRTKPQTFAFAPQLARKVQWKMPIEGFVAVAKNCFYKFIHAGNAESIGLVKRNTDT